MRVGTGKIEGDRDMAVILSGKQEGMLYADMKTTVLVPGFQLRTDSDRTREQIIEGYIDELRKEGYCIFYVFDNGGTYRYELPDLPKGAVDDGHKSN